MAIDLLKYMIWRNGAGGGGGDYEEKTVGPAPILHIEDALKRPLTEYTFDVNPVQDLNGQSSPYPAGGGANKWDGTFNTLIPLEIASGTTVCLQCVLNDTSKYITLRTYDSDQTFLQSMITASVSGNINYGVLTLTSDATYIRVEKAADVTVTNGMLSIGNNTPQTYAPYSNICPISGWKTVNVWNDPKYGGNIEWNQLLPETGTENTGRGVTCTPNGDGSWTLTGNGTGTYRHEILPVSGVDVNDVIIFTSGCDTKGSASTFYVSLRYSSGSSVVNGTTKIKIIKANEPFDIFSVHTFSGFVAPEGGLVIKPQLFNLTQMFGSTVADSVLAMEQAEAGSGIAWFQNLFPKPYYPYNAGEHTCVSAVNGGQYGKYPITFGAVGKNLLPMGDISINDSLYAHSYTSSNYQNFSMVVDAMKSLVGKTVVYSAKTTGTASGVTIGQIRFAKVFVGGSDNLFSLDPNQSAEVPNADWDGVTNIIIYGSGTGATISDLQIELGTTPSSYEPYTDTVYGGTVDVVNSTVTVTGILEQFNRVDGNNLNSQMNYISRTGNIVSTVGDVTRISFSIDTSVDQTKYNRISSSYAADEQMCNMARHYFSYNDSSTHWYRNTVLYVYLPTALVGDTQESVYDYLVSIKDTNPLSLYVPLAEPQTYPITPETVITLYKGQNNLWADSGDSTGTYVSSDPYKETVGPAQIVSVTNALKKPAVSLIASMSPAQDLHGQTSPYPPGGGVNLLDPSKTSIYGEDSSHYGIHVEFDSSTEIWSFSGTSTSTSASAAFNFLSYSDASLSGKSYFIQAFDVSGTGSACFKSVYGFRTESETVCAIVFDFSSVQDINITLKISVAATSQTAWAPYENICPITGWMGVTAERTGKNILNLSEWEVESNSGITIGTDNITINHMGYQENLNRYNVLKRSACVFSFHVKTVALGDSRASFAVYADGTAKLVGSGTTNFGNITLDSVGEEKDITLTVPNGTEYISFGGWAWTGEVQISNLQIELGSTVSPYEPRVGATYPVVFPALGKNLFNYKATAPYSSVPLTVEEQSNGYKITISGSGNKTIRLVLGVLSEGQYTFSGVCKDGSDTTKSVYLSKNGATLDVGMTFTADGVSEYGVLFFGSNEEGPYTFTNIQLERGSSATAFEPYTNTVYGGTVDLVSGGITATHGKVVLDGTQTGINANWRATETSVGWLYPWSLTENARTITPSEIPNLTCDTLPVSNYNVAYNGTNDACITLVNGDGVVWGLAVRYPDLTLTTAAAINAFLSNHPITVVYELAEPKTYQLTPTQQIQMLKGANTLWSDGDSVTLTYLAKKE